MHMSNKEGVLNMDRPDDNILRALLDPGPIPRQAQEKMDAAYARLAGLPQRKAAHATPARWRRAMAAAAVAAAVALGGTAVLAATGGLLPMVEGTIRFFTGGEETNLDSIQAAFEACNAAVDASVTDQGITFTVENVSVDQNFINIFGRLTAQDSIRELAEQHNWPADMHEDGSRGEAYQYYRHGLPESDLQQAAGLFPVARVNGKVYGFDASLKDACNFYLEDDHTLAFARRILLAEALPDSFTMEILPAYATDENGEYQQLMERRGDWTIAVSLDIAATQSAVRAVQPGGIALGGAGTLDLKNFQWTPLGTVLCVDEHVRPVAGTGDAEGRFPDYAQEEGYLSMGQVAVRDDLGNWLYPMQAAGYPMGDEKKVEYTSPAANAKAIVFVPVTQTGASGEQRFAPAQKGAKLEMGAHYGFTVGSIAVEERRLTVKLLPYGPHTAHSMGLEVFPAKADGGSLDDNDRMLLTAKTDHATGMVTLDYYFDIDGEPEGTAQLCYYSWGDQELDEADAVTLPLKEQN